jgi:hypothetical protein
MKQAAAAGPLFKTASGALLSRAERLAAASTPFLEEEPRALLPSLA